LAPETTRRILAVVRRYGIAIGVAALVAFGALFVLQGRSEFGEIAQALGAVEPVWVGLIAALHLVALGIAAVTYRVVLRRLGYSLDAPALAEIHLKRFLVGTIAPVGGPPSLYVFLRSLGQRGVSTGDALVTLSMRGVTGYTSFLLLLIPAFLLQRPSGLILAAASVLFALLIGAFAVIGILLRPAVGPTRLEARAPRPVRSFLAQTREHRLGFADFVLPFQLGLLSHLVNAAMLYVGLRAVGYEASIAVVLIGYAVGNLFLMLSPAFQGVGLVELTMVIALQQAGVPATAAIAATLLFRFGDLWLPLMIGAVLQVVRSSLVRRAAWSIASATMSGALAATGLLSGVRSSTEPPRLSRGLAPAVLVLEISIAPGIAAWASFGAALTSSL
jgi:uncharacterized protein (TIRG00374 family)